MNTQERKLHTRLISEVGEATASDVVRFRDQIETGVAILLDDLFSPKLRAASEKRLNSIIKSVTKDMIGSFIQHLGYVTGRLPEARRRPGVIAEAFLPNLTNGFMPLKSIASKDFLSALEKVVEDVYISEDQRRAVKMSNNVSAAMKSLEPVMEELEGMDQDDLRVSRSLHLISDAYELLHVTDDRLSAIAELRD
mgnify:FL=1